MLTHFYIQAFLKLYTKRFAVTHDARNSLNEKIIDFKIESFSGIQIHFQIIHLW